MCAAGICAPEFLHNLISAHCAIYPFVGFTWFEGFFRKEVGASNTCSHQGSLDVPDKTTAEADEVGLQLTLMDVEQA